jgi:hypothetical protein
MKTTTTTKQATKQATTKSISVSNKASVKVKKVNRVTYLKSNVTGKELQALSKQGTQDYKTAELSFSKHLSNLEKYDLPLLKSFVKYNKTTFAPKPILNTMSDLEKYVSNIKYVAGLQVINKQGSVVRELSKDANGNNIEKFFTYTQVKKYVVRYYKGLK